MDSARCTCQKDALGKRCADNPACAIHGLCSPHPVKPYRLTDTDRELLRSFRIAITDTTEIQDVRKADEDRWKR